MKVLSLRRSRLGIKTLCVMSLFFGMTQAGYAQDCESQFVDMRPHEANAMLAVDVWNAKSPEAKVASVLAMVGESGLPKLNGKAWKKDGELKLGLKNQGGSTLLATYRIDGSVDGALPRLVELEVRGKGTANTLISAEPVDATTGRLRPEVAVHPLVAAVRRELPLELSSELTTFLRDHIDILDYAESKDFRSLAQSGNPASELRKLRMTLKGRWIKEVISKDLVKQIFRGVLFGGVVFGSSVLAVMFTGEDQKAPKTALDAMAALLLVEISNMEAESGVKIPDVEKLRLVSEATKLPRKPAEGEILRLQDIEVASTLKSRLDRGPEKFWVMDKQSKRIFVGLAESVYDLKVRGENSSAPKVELNTRALVEIRASDMPMTYQIASKRFQFENTEKEMKKVGGK
jgi:hypothetical protein